MLPEEKARVKIDKDLLNMMTWSYKLSSHKIKAPHRLRIVCKKSRGFSINNIDK